jgi:hypothetical protein
MGFQLLSGEFFWLNITTVGVRHIMNMAISAEEFPALMFLTFGAILK